MIASPNAGLARVLGQERFRERAIVQKGGDVVLAPLAPTQRAREEPLKGFVRMHDLGRFHLTQGEGMKTEAEMSTEQAVTPFHVDIEPSTPRDDDVTEMLARIEDSLEIAFPSTVLTRW